MTDDQLIGYCELHCETPRALFSGTQVNRMLELAGHPKGWITSIDKDRWVSLHEEMKELCKMARARRTLVPIVTHSNVVSLAEYRVALARRNK